VCCRTPFRRPPILAGKEVDLYLLYTLVTGQGGWIKVGAMCEQLAPDPDAEQTRFRRARRADCTEGAAEQGQG
jgi:hypothetical protein